MTYTSGPVLSTEANMLTDKTTTNTDRHAEKDGGERRIQLTSNSVLYSQI